MSTRLIGLQQGDEWGAALEDLPHSYWHGWRAHQAFSQATGQPAYLFVHENQHGKVACPFLERRWGDAIDIAGSPGFAGFTGRGEISTFRDAWLQLVESRRYVCGYFPLHPETAVLAMHTGITEVNTLYTLDLRVGAAAILQASSRTVKRSMAAWRESGAEYVDDRDALSDFIRANYAEFMASVGANPRGVWSDVTLRSMLQDPKLRMVGARDDAGICAAHTFAVGGAGAENHLNVSVRGGRTLTTALLFWGIDRLCSDGIAWLQMGGGVVKDDAVAQAKQKYRPLPRPLHVAREIYRHDAFMQLASAHAPRGPTSFFPPYRQGITGDRDLTG